MKTIEQTIKNYKNTILKKMRSFDEKYIRFMGNDLTVMRKIDGHNYYICKYGDTIVITNGKRKFESPKHLAEINKYLDKCDINNIVIAAELATNSKRPKSKDVSSFIDSNPDKLALYPFDIVESDKNVDIKNINLCFNGCNLVKQIEIYENVNHDRLKSIYNDLVVKNSQEGLIVKDKNNLIKWKPEVTLDLAIVGYGLDNNVINKIVVAYYNSVDDAYHLIGNVGSGLSEDDKTNIKKSTSIIDCNYVYPNDNGTKCLFVKPLPVEIKCNDVVFNDDNPNATPLLKFGNEFKFIRNKNNVSLIHPVFLRLREDKNYESDIDENQINRFHSMEEIKNDCLKNVVKSEIYTKKIGHKSMLKKYTLVDCCGYFAIYSTDISSGRKNPIENKIRLVTKDIYLEYNETIKSEISKGWIKV